MRKAKAKKIVYLLGLRWTVSWLFAAQFNLLTLHYIATLTQRHSLFIAHLAFAGEDRTLSR